MRVFNGLRLSEWKRSRLSSTRTKISTHGRPLHITRTAHWRCKKLTPTAALETTYYLSTCSRTSQAEAFLRRNTSPSLTLPVLISMRSEEMGKTVVVPGIIGIIWLENSGIDTQNEEKGE